MPISRTTIAATSLAAALIAFAAPAHAQSADAPPSAKPKPASMQIVGNVDIDAKSTFSCWPCGISVRARAEQKTLYEDGATDVGAANGPPPTGSTDIGKPAANLAHMKQVLTVGTSVGAPRYK